LCGFHVRVTPSQVPTNIKIHQPLTHTQVDVADFVFQKNTAIHFNPQNQDTRQEGRSGWSHSVAVTANLEETLSGQRKRTLKRVSLVIPSPLPTHTIKRAQITSLEEKHHLVFHAADPVFVEANARTEDRAKISSGYMICCVRQGHDHREYTETH
jgi:hypothetical protein